MRRVGVLLAGCGVYDGSDVQETMLLVLALLKRGFRAVFLAPDVEQPDVVDHSTGSAVPGAPARRVLEEAARISRGTIRDLASFAADEIDALVIPGGMGVVRNLTSGKTPRPEVAGLLDALSERGAPFGVVGLASVLLARHRGEELTDAPIRAAADEVIASDDGAVFYTPGFLGTDTLADVVLGVDRLVDALAVRLGGSR